MATDFIKRAADALATAFKFSQSRFRSDSDMPVVRIPAWAWPEFVASARHELKASEFYRIGGPLIDGGPFTLFGIRFQPAALDCDERDKSLTPLEQSIEDYDEELRTMPPRWAGYLGGEKHTPRAAA